MALDQQHRDDAEAMATERSQQYGDLVRLLAAVRETAPPDPERQGVREYLLAKLTALLERPAAGRGEVRVA